jgi:hypothetical protein
MSVFFLSRRVSPFIRYKMKKREVIVKENKRFFIELMTLFSNSITERVGSFCRSTFLVLNL